MIGASPSVASSRMMSRGFVIKRPANRQHLLLATGELIAAVGAALLQAREEGVDPLDVPAGLAETAGGRGDQILLDS